MLEAGLNTTVPSKLLLLIFYNHPINTYIYGPNLEMDASGWKKVE